MEELILSFGKKTHAVASADAGKKVGRVAIAGEIWPQPSWASTFWLLSFAPSTVPRRGGISIDL
jgi:hypothetical protein